MTTIKYMSPDEVADLIKTPGNSAGKDYLIVDVRDHDFVGGNITGAKNYPSNDFLKDVDSLVKDAKNIPTIIFHCALSQQRGPKAARIYKETRQNILGGDETIPQQEIAILRSGFASFQDKYRHDPLLVEKWDPDYWREDWL